MKKVPRVHRNALMIFYFNFVKWQTLCLMTLYHKIYGKKKAHVQVIHQNMGQALRQNPTP